MQTVIIKFWERFKLFVDAGVSNLSLAYALPHREFFWAPGSSGKQFRPNAWRCLHISRFLSLGVESPRRGAIQDILSPPLLRTVGVIPLCPAPVQRCETVRSRAHLSWKVRAYHTTDANEKLTYVWVTLQTEWHGMVYHCMASMGVALWGSHVKPLIRLNNLQI